MRLLHLLLLLIYIPVFAALGQTNAEIEEYQKQLLEAKDDTSKIIAMNLLSWAHQTSQPDKALVYAQQALELAQKASFHKGRINAYTQLGYYYQLHNKYAPAMKYYTLAWEAAKNAGLKNFEGVPVCGIGEIYEIQGNYKEALNHYMLFMEASRIAALQDEEATALNKIGQVYKIQGMYNEALKYYMIFLSIARAGAWKEDEAIASNNIGEVYRLQGNYTLALEYGLKALRIKEKLGNQKAIGNSYNNIGNIYEALQDNQRAIEYYWKALKIREEIKDSTGISSSLHNIGIIYRNQGNLSDALRYLLQSLAIDRKLDDKVATLYSLNEVAFAYYKQEKYSQAAQMYLEAVNLNKNMNVQAEMTRSLLGLARIHIATNKPLEAADFALQGLLLAKETGTRSEILKAYEILHQVYARLRQFEKAYEYRGLYMQMKDSLFNEENFKKITSLQSSYDLEKKQAEIALLSKDRQLQQQEIGRQNLLLSASGIGSVLVLLLAGVLFRSNRQSRQKNTVLTEQKQQIESYVEEIQAQQQNLQQVLVQMEQQNQQLQDSEVELLKLNALKNKYFSILSHDLRNSFASLKAYLPLLRMHLGEVQNPEVPALLDTFKDNIHHVNTLLDNVLLWSLSQMNMMPMEPKKLLLHELAQHNLRLIEPFAMANGITLFNDTPGNQLVFVDENMLNSIFRNLLSNAIKFTPQGGSIGISSELKGQDVEIVVLDSGEGISEEDQWKLFNLRTNSTTTKAAKGTGLGLVLCREFVEKSGGSIRVESSKGKGTRFIFTLQTAEVLVQT